MASESAGDRLRRTAAEDAGRGGVMERTAVLITGMHRNGTSALARTLSLLGAALPDDLVPANEGNQLGHWEPKGMVDLNDRMLAHAGSDLYSTRDIDPAWFSSTAADDFAAEAERSVRGWFGDERLIVLKDPRTALLAPIWNAALAAAGYRVVHVHPLRHPAEVAESLRRRHLKTFPYDAWVRPRGEAVWLRYTLAAVRGSRGHAHAFLRYDELLADWRRELARLGDELGIAWPELGTSAEREVDAFLHANEHAGVDLPPIDTEARDLRTLDLPALASLCFAELASSGDHGASIDALQGEFADRIRDADDLIATLEGLYPLVWRYFEDGEAARRRLDLSVAAEGRLRDKARQSWAALTEANGDKLRMLLEAGSRDRQVVSLRDEVARLDGLVAYGSARSAELEAQIAHFPARIAGLEAEHDAGIAEERSIADEARQGRAAVESRLDALWASTSWRVTAPLRALSRAARRRP